MGDIRRRVPDDRSVISMAEAWEVEYWCEELICTPEELIAAMKEVGTSTERVRRYLGFK